MYRSKVIAISGASGAGKTTIVQKLSAEFACPFLLFDHHTDKNTYPSNMKTWLKHGANFSLIKTPKFTRALQTLVTKSTSPFVFIEEPFGKERRAMNSLIDYVVLLDQPLELCLTRIIKRHTIQANENSLTSIDGFLDKYEDHLRDVYITAVNQVRVQSDLVISEVTSIEETANTISHWLRNKKASK
jgi:uridine kinase